MPQLLSTSPLPPSPLLPHSHVFESVDEDRATDTGLSSSGIGGGGSSSSSKSTIDTQIRALEVALDELRRRRGLVGGGGSSGIGGSGGSSGVS